MHNMEEIEKLLSRQFSTQQTDPELSSVSSYLRKRPADRKSQKYGQWAVQIIRKVSLGQRLRFVNILVIQEVFDVLSELLVCMNDRAKLCFTVLHICIYYVVILCSG